MRRLLIVAAVAVGLVWFAAPADAASRMPSRSQMSAAQRAGYDAVLAVFSRSTEQKAARVAWCESRLLSNRPGRAGELGIFQIHPVHHRNARARGMWPLTNPTQNARFAHYLSRGGSNWRPWSCRRA